MINIPVSEIIDIVSKKTGKSKDEIRKLIDSKLLQLQGLISEEGAAHIVANELDVKLVRIGELVTLNEIKLGMNAVETIGKITRIYDVREFSKDSKSGKVVSLMIADETGSIRLTLWNKQVDVISNFKENDTIFIKNAYVKENNGRKELHLSDRGEIRFADKIIVEKSYQPQDRKRKKIADLQDGETAEILGFAVQVFDPSYYDTCPNCNRRVKPRDDFFECQEHGKVAPTKGYIFNLVIDDESDNIRVTCFKNQVKNFIKLSDDEIVKLKDNPEKLENLKKSILGNMYKIIGRVQTNEMFNRQDFVAQLIFLANPDEEIKNLEVLAKDKALNLSEIELSQVKVESNNEVKVKSEKFEDFDKKDISKKPKSYVEVTEEDFLKDTYLSTDSDDESFIQEDIVEDE